MRFGYLIQQCQNRSRREGDAAGYSPEGRQILAQGGSPGTAPRQRSTKPWRGERGGGPIESDFLSHPPGFVHTDAAPRLTPWTGPFRNAGSAVRLNPGTGRESIPICARPAPGIAAKILESPKSFPASQVSESAFHDSPLKISCNRRNSCRALNC